MSDSSATQASAGDSPENRALAKLREFIRDGLDPDERIVVASLLAPAVAQAFDPVGADVEGFAAVEWRPTIPETLADGIRASGIRVLTEPEV